MTKPSSYSTVTMVIYLIYSMSKWISTYSELLPSIGILPIAALLDLVPTIEEYTTLLRCQGSKPTKLI
ncbi:hypothetical protein Gohar_026933, partial [Gossypium harknessii]|nr:hypothetical protein [Gossypium harknessii]